MNPLRCGRVVRGGLRCTYVPSLRFSTCPSSSSSPSSSFPSTSTSISAEKERSFRGRVENKGSHEVSNTRRLDAFLCSQLPDLSRARIQESVRAGTASVNGRVQIKPAFKLRPGDEVSRRRQRVELEGKVWFLADFFFFFFFCIFFPNCLVTHRPRRLSVK